MAEFGRGETLWPSKWRIRIGMATPSGGQTEWSWSLMPPAPDNRVLAVSIRTYRHEKGAREAAKKFFKRNRVNLLLLEKRVDFTQQPCITPPSSP